MYFSFLMQKTQPRVAGLVFSMHLKSKIMLENIIKNT